MIKTTSILKTCVLIPFISLLMYGQNTFAQKKKLFVPDNFPYELKPEQEIGLMLTGTGLLYGSVIGHNNKPGWGQIPISRLDPKSVWFIDRMAINNWDPGLNKAREVFEPALTLTSLGLIGAYGLISNNQKKNWSEMMSLTLMYMEGLYLSSGVMLLTKSLVNRARPYAYNKALSMEDRIRPANNESFFSGNATILFYNASFLSLLSLDLYPEARWPSYLIGGTFAIAELSAWWSIRSGMHFPTDVLTGAIWGSATALFINRIHKKGAHGLNIMPWVIQQGKGIAVRYWL